MKKIFTLIAVAAMAIGANAQTTLIDFPTSKAGTSISGTTIEGEITVGETTYSAYVLKNGYSSGGAYNENSINLTTEGGFKTGDVIKIAGIINKDDESKYGTVQIFTLEGEDKVNKIFKFENFENLAFGGTIKEQTYTLEADADKLYFGRDGGTNTYVTLIKITRGGAAGINTVKAVEAENGAAYNLAGQKVADGFKGVVIKNGKKMIQK